MTDQTIAATTPAASATAGADGASAVGTRRGGGVGGAEGASVVGTRRGGAVDRVADGVREREAMSVGMSGTRSRPYPSPVGVLTLVASDVGLRAVLWPDDTRVRIDPPPVECTDPHPVLDVVERQLDEYFAGARRVFDLPLDLVGTAFQVDVWRSLAAIGFGSTSTYGEQAERLGRPTAVRAVGSANGRNPVSIVLPCHRVVGRDGSLTGFAGGLDAKRFLLDHEAAVVAAGS